MANKIFAGTEKVQWRLKHDERGPPVVPEETRLTDDHADIVQWLANPIAGKKYKACGSHWALSSAAIPDDISLETNMPVANAAPRLNGLAEDLAHIATGDFIHYLVNHPPATGNAITADPCLQYRYGPFFVHMKAGTKVYEAYSLLDDPAGPLGNSSLLQLLRSKLAQQPGGRADAYDGPWGFPTLGGSGGQTVFGALTTGTHGGDYRQGPISDYVAALLLVTYGGQQYWIEPRGDRSPVPIADEAKLRQHFPNIPATDPIKVIRDTAIFDAVVCGVGRFGVVTSFVAVVVPQYCLLEHRELANWSDIRNMLLGPQKHHTFDKPFFSSPDRQQKVSKFEQRFATQTSQINNRFLQIAINVSPHHLIEHRCGVTQRWWVSASSPEATNADGTVPGRAERGATQTAGASFPYEPPEPGSGEKAQTTGTFLSRACAAGSFYAGILRQLAQEITKIIRDGFVEASSPLFTALAIGTGGAVIALGAGLCAALAAAVALLTALADAIDAAGDESSLASAVHGAAEDILEHFPRPLALMALRFLLLKAFESQQSYRQYVAISYAVMDGHDYFDRSCYSDAESIEVFFDASRPDIYCTYLDLILAFEHAFQLNEGKITVGYVSLRFIKGSHALIGPARYPETLAIEVAEIRHDDGSSPFVSNAAAVARHPMFGAPFHWGQYNPLTRAEVDRIFNSSPKPGALNIWRDILNMFLQNQSVKDGFSNSFTRQTGLEP